MPSKLCPRSYALEAMPRQLCPDSYALRDRGLRVYSLDSHGLRIISQAIVSRVIASQAVFPGNFFTQLSSTQAFPAKLLHGKNSVNLAGARTAKIRRNHFDPAGVSIPA